MEKKDFSFYEAYNFDYENHKSVEKVAFDIYVEPFYMLAILEAFLITEVLDFKELNKAVVESIPKHLLWESTGKQYHDLITKMVKLGYVEAVGTEGLPNFKLTPLGLETLQQQTFQALCTTSFFNYQTHLLNKETHLLNKEIRVLSKRSLLVSIAAMIVAVLSLFATLYPIFCK